MAADQSGQRGPRLIVAHDGDEGGGGAQSGYVAQDVAGSAGHLDFAVDGQDRHWRFDADPRHLPIDVPVEHHVAHDQYVGVRQSPYRGLEIRFGCIR